MITEVTRWGAGSINKIMFVVEIRNVECKSMNMIIFLFYLCSEMLNKVTSTMVTGDGEAAAGEQVNLNELDAQMEQIKDMFVKKQEMMKKMSTTTAPNPAELKA